MRSNRLGRKEREIQQDKKNYFFTFLCVIFVVCVGGYVLYSNFFKPVTQYDEFGCPIRNGISSPIAQTVVLVDETDVLSTNQSDYLRIKLTSYVKKEMLTGELLSIYFLGDDLNTHTKPIFEMCKVRDGSDADALTENERLIKRRFRKNFQEPLHEKMNMLLEKKTASNQSPILEMIQSIALNSFMKWDVQGDRKLMIFSDMLHHTKEFSLYTQNPSFESFKRSDYAAGVASSMPGVEVEIYYFNNTPQFQKNSLTEFWRDFFRNRGALVSQVQTIGK